MGQYQWDQGLHPGTGFRCSLLWKRDRVYRDERLLESEKLRLQHGGPHASRCGSGVQQWMGKFAGNESVPEFFSHGSFGQERPGMERNRIKDPEGR